ncbi:hydrolase [Microvirga sp. KLBC 81]|uniref:amidohydrolase family protein n=1 Tax=Microvirga sp. KLBC 81 TaxID=1862707 RepID=UPI000D523825|nr:amidohydrolase family protein [Microvirga sp. KLBC 81]PVE22945.1 hydrolase [Microvirga sp. KLBC 81]
MERTDRILTPVVDTHAHIFRRDLPFIPGVRQDFKRDFTTEDYLAELDAAGVRYGVVAAASFLGTYHDYTLSALERHSRLRATVVVDPDVSQAHLRELDRAGIIGIRFATGNMAAPPDLRSAEYKKLLRAIADLDWHVHVYGRREHLPELLSALDTSGVKIVVDHFGARDNQSGIDSESFRAILSTMKNGRTWVKLSGPYLSDSLDHRELTSRFLAEAGSTRLLWGSDWPFVKLNGHLRYSQAVDWLAEWVPDEGIRQQIDVNALELYRFPRPS